jgi:heterodisulfide reductase subunit A-like polyferredoxin
VVINPGWGPAEVIGTKGKVTGIRFKKCTSVYNEQHRFSPSYDETQTIELQADMVIFAIGQTVQRGKLFEGSKVEFFRGVYPEGDKFTLQTAQEDIFVGGDCLTGPKFAIDAIATGKEAAESLHRYVQHGHMTIGRNRRDFIELNKDDITVESYDNSSRQTAGEATDRKPFEEYHLTLTEEQVRKETARCLGCGASVVDPNRCIGCGICTTKCAFDAIHLYRENPECSKMVKSEDKVGALLPYVLKRNMKILVKKGDCKK